MTTLLNCITYTTLILTKITLLIYIFYILNKNIYTLYIYSKLCLVVMDHQGSLWCMEQNDKYIQSMKLIGLSLPDTLIFRFMLGKGTYQLAIICFFCHYPYISFLSLFPILHANGEKKAYILYYIHRIYKNARRIKIYIHTFSFSGEGFNSFSLVLDWNSC